MSSGVRPWTIGWCKRRSMRPSKLHTSETSSRERRKRSSWQTKARLGVTRSGWGCRKCRKGRQESITRDSSEPRMTFMPSSLLSKSKSWCNNKWSGKQNSRIICKMKMKMTWVIWKKKSSMNTSNHQTCKTITHWGISSDETNNNQSFLGILIFQINVKKKKES